MAGLIRRRWGALAPPCLALGLVPAAAGAAPPSAWPKDAFLPVTAERVQGLPAAEQARWREYLAASLRRARTLPQLSHREDRTPGPSDLPRGGRHTKGLPEDQPRAWYASSEAATIADRVVERQTPAGGWTKGIDYTRPGAPVRGEEGVDAWSRGTLDNDATSSELQFLSRVAAVGGAKRAAVWRRSLERGLDYLLAAQYPNGGFPQIYPLAGGYHDAITFNDSAMVHALEVLRDAAAGEGGYAGIPAARRRLAAEALRRGIACVLASQIELPGGRRTAWAQQHDALTLRPCAARNFEPIAACTQESAAIVEFLMALPEPSAAVVGSVDDAVAWLRSLALHDVVWQRAATDGSGLLAAPGAPLLWARLYEIGTDRPVFGDRDRSIHYAVTELSAERRLGYGWYGRWPTLALERYAAWRSRQGR